MRVSYGNRVRIDVWQDKERLRQHLKYTDALNSQRLGIAAASETDRLRQELDFADARATLSVCSLASISL